MSPQNGAGYGHDFFRRGIATLNRNAQENP